MRGGGKYKKHAPSSDYRYERVDAGRFINYLMQSGKYSVAERVFYKALDEVKKLSKKDPIEVFEKALENATPSIEVVSRRVGGASYQVPIDVRPARKAFLSSSWIIRAARKRKGSAMSKRLAEEIFAAANNDGEAIRRKHTMHRMAEANRAFAGFARRKKKS